ncbi:hypothetical protein A0H81_08797 [Grifola frondosa]|uniref:Uncharacterized protein n=1 Tax=Grifola frondosa TaxID=5627 RepID=A0A1C7M2R1_GRIFR|nr:hypothetical protein A0H81_08797 [Grifola frondosa]
MNWVTAGDVRGDAGEIVRTTLTAPKRRYSARRGLHKRGVLEMSMSTAAYSDNAIEAPDNERVTADNSKFPDRANKIDSRRRVMLDGVPHPVV